MGLRPTMNHHQKEQSSSGPKPMLFFKLPSFALLSQVLYALSIYDSSMIPHNIGKMIVSCHAHKPNSLIDLHSTCFI